jgi:rhamnosyltransferase
MELERADELTTPATGVHAVIVTYEPGDGILDTVRAVRSQVAGVIVVDNGSGSESRRALALLEGQEGTLVVRLGANRGIAAAQNRGIERAEQLGATWVLTLDQDSLCGKGMVSALFEGAGATPGQLGFACPSVRAPGDSPPRDRSLKVNEVPYAISSGCLIRWKPFVPPEACGRTSSSIPSTSSSA